MKKVLVLLIIFAVSFSGLFAQYASANWQNPPMRGDAQKCQLISKSSAMRMAASMTGAKAVSASLSRGSRPMYRVKVINQSGRIRYVTVNACR